MIAVVFLPTAYSWLALASSTQHSAFSIQPAKHLGLKDYSIFGMATFSVYGIFENALAKGSGGCR